MSKAAALDVGQTSSPSEIRLEPEVIDILPPRAHLPDELSKFCFPDDMHLSTELFPPRAFDIVLTDIKGVRRYGSCLHFFEEKRPVDVLALISAGQKSRTANLPPWISLKDIQQGQTKWRCFVPKCLCVLSSSPLFQTFQSFLGFLYQLSRSPSTNLSLESLVFNFLERIPLPSADATQTVFRLGDRTSLLSGFAAISPQFSPTEVDFTILFQCLSPENILKVYCYLLTEKKVVLCSSNRAILTHAAETLRALLHPFECQQVYIPVLPLSLLEFVCAPVPFFMGIHSDHRVEKLTAEGVIVVDLGRNEVRVPQNEILPSLPEGKAKKLLSTLRKLSAWPASQNSRYSFGQGVEARLPSVPASFYPSKAFHTEVAQLVQRQDELTEKWGDIQLLFAAFATRLLKDIRKHCTKGPAVASNRRSSEVVVFDSRGFLAMNPSYREFCVHLFQTQLFQRSLESIWTFSDIPSVADSELNWRAAVRSKGVLRKPSESGDDAAKTQRRRIVHAPLPPQKEKQKSPGSTDLAPTDGFPAFNAQLYEELLDDFMTAADACEPSSCEFSTVAPRLSTPTLSSEHSSTSILTSPSFHDGDADALQLVNAARKRLEEKRNGDIAEYAH